MNIRKDVKTTKIIEFYKSGFSINEIANKFSCSEQTILYRLKKANFPRRTCKEGGRLARAKGRGHLFKSMVGVKHPAWKGGRIEEKNKGYVRLWVGRDYPNNIRSYVREHRYIWERANKKILPKNWIVHHLNGIKNDNRIENLIALPNKKHYLLLKEKARRIRELEDEIKK